MYKEGNIETVEVHRGATDKGQGNANVEAGSSLNGPFLVVGSGQLFQTAYLDRGTRVHTREGTRRTWK